MDFLERIFNLWPDGGNGSTEIAIVVSVVLAVILWWTFPATTARRLGLHRSLP